MESPRGVCFIVRIVTRKSETRIRRLLSRKQNEHVGMYTLTSTLRTSLWLWAQVSSPPQVFIGRAQVCNSASGNKVRVVRELRTSSHKVILPVKLRLCLIERVLGVAHGHFGTVVNWPHECFLNAGGGCYTVLCYSPTQLANTCFSNNKNISN